MRALGQRLISFAVVLLFLLTPLFDAYAIVPFGGRVTVPTPCLNNGGIHVFIGPPRGGSYVWFPGTRTYLYDPPIHPAQWTLGRAGPPTFCIESYDPLRRFPGLLMLMLGTSV